MGETPQRGPPSKPAPARRWPLLIGLGFGAVIVAWKFVSPLPNRPGVFTLGAPVAAAIRFGLLGEFLRCAYLGLEGRSPSRVTSATYGSFWPEAAERAVMLLFGSFIAVVAVAWLGRIPLRLPGLAGTTAAAAATIGTFQLLGASARFLPYRYRRWIRWGLTTLLAFGLLAVLWRIGVAPGGDPVGSATNTAVFGRLWGLFPPAMWLERTMSVYAQFHRITPPTVAPYAGLAVAALVYGGARWLTSRRRR